MATLESTAQANRLNELTEIARCIFGAIVSRNKLEHNTNNAQGTIVLDPVLTSINHLETYLSKSVGNQEQILEQISGIRDAILIQTDRTIDQSTAQENCLSGLLDRTDDFLELEEENQKKTGLRGLIPNLISSTKQAFTGFFTNLFRPKPRVVILAKSSIKDIAGLFRLLPSRKQSKVQSFKDTVKKAAATDIVSALASSVTKIGNAIATGVRSIALALNVFVYVLFPLVLLGAVGILVVGLYFIAKMIVEALVSVATQAMTMFKDQIGGILNAIAGYINAITNLINFIVDTIRTVVEAPMTILSGLFDLISTGVEKFVGIVSSVWDVLKSIASTIVGFLSPKKIVSTAVSGVTSLLSGDKKEKTDVSFDTVTEPVCRAIHDFSDMVKDYLATIVKARTTEVIRTNVTPATTVTSLATETTNRAGSSYTDSVNSNISTINTNTSSSMDGTSSISSVTTKLAKYTNEYTIESNSTNDNTDIVNQIKETNSLLHQLLTAFSSVNQNDSQFSMIGA